MAIKTAEIIGVVLLGMSLPALGQTPIPPTVGFCVVVGSPAVYHGRLITTAATLSPGEHSLLLHSVECEPKAGFDVRVQAVLPPKLESLRHGRKLESILNHGRGARVEVVGTFDATTGPFGPDVMPFRFRITDMHSVAEVRREK
jgi:hypothetical protein